MRERSGELRLMLSKPVVRFVVVIAGWVVLVRGGLKMLLLLLLPVVLPVVVVARVISSLSPGVVSVLCLPPLKSLLVSLPLCTVCALSGLAGGTRPNNGVEEPVVPVVPVVPALDLGSTKGSEASDC